MKSTKSLNKKRGIAPGLAHALAFIAAEIAEAKKKMRMMPQAVAYREQQGKLVKRIADAMDAAKRVEDLVYLEMALQEMDRDLAQTEQEQGSIDKAQRDYRELLHAIEQMRSAPEEYMRANLSITSQNVLKMPDARGPMKIKSNLARLQNRAMFAEEEDRNVWDARIAMAHKTDSLLKTLHKDVAVEFAQK